MIKGIWVEMKNSYYSSRLLLYRIVGIVAYWVLH